MLKVNTIEKKMYDGRGLVMRWHFTMVVWREINIMQKNIYTHTFTHVVLYLREKLHTKEI